MTILPIVVDAADLITMPKPSSTQLAVAVNLLVDQFQPGVAPPSPVPLLAVITVAADV